MKIQMDWVGMIVATFGAIGLSSCQPARNEASSATKSLSPYVGALVFEGGRGEIAVPLRKDHEPERQVPLWRTYLCIERKEGTISGSLEFSLKTLNGAAYREEWTDEYGRVTSAHLSQLTVHYTYSVGTENSIAGLYFKASSNQMWTLRNPDGSPSSSLADHLDLDLFNPEWSTERMVFHSSSGYVDKGQNYYVDSTFDLFGLSNPIQSEEGRKARLDSKRVCEQYASASKNVVQLKAGEF